MTAAARALAILSVCVATPACAPEPRTPDEVHAVIEFPVDSLDPRFALSAYGQKLSALVFAGLVGIDARGFAVPDLAATVEMPASATYVITLRPGLVFHDGSPVTPRDVKFTIENFAAAETKSPFAPAFQRVRRVTAGPGLRVEIELDAPYAPFLADLAKGILPERAVRADPEGFLRRPVGAGPFRLEGDLDAENVVLRAFAQYHGGAPKIAKLAVRTVRDDTARILELIDGKADFAQNAVSFAMLPRLRAYAGIGTVQGPSNNYTYAAFNLRDAVTGDLRVRRAVAHAIDRENLIRHKFKGAARLAKGMLAPEHWAYTDNVEAFAYNPEKAKQLLDEAGFTDPDGDGPAPRLTLEYKTSTNKFRKALALAIADQLARVGIAAEVRALDWGTFFGDIRTGRFQMCTLMWTRVIEPDLLRQVFHSSMIPGEGNAGGFNRGAYRNEIVDHLLDEAAAAMDMETRRELYARAQKIIASELPYLSLWHEDNIAVYDTRLQGYELTPDAFFQPFAAAWVSGPPSPRVRAEGG